MSKKARPCVTHFHACDCREAEFEQARKYCIEAQEETHRLRLQLQSATFERNCAQKDLATAREALGKILREYGDETQSASESACRMFDIAEATLAKLSPPQ